jgi:hypothetical protein
MWYVYVPLNEWFSDALINELIARESLTMQAFYFHIQYSKVRGLSWLNLGTALGGSAWVHFRGRCADGAQHAYDICNASANIFSNHALDLKINESRFQQNGNDST